MLRFMFNNDNNFDFILTMKENKGKKLRNMFDQDFSNFQSKRKEQAVMVQQISNIQKQEVRKKILLEKEKNRIRDERIKQLREESKAQQLEKERNEQTLRKLTKKAEQMKKISLNPSYLEELRQTFKSLKRQLGIELMLPQQQEQLDPDQMTYQQLLELEEKIGKVSKGLTQSQLNKVQRFAYKGTLQSEKKCIVCCYEFEQGVECVKLKCEHLFHSECILEWLKSQKVCPLCKSETV